MTDAEIKNKLIEIKLRRIKRRWLKRRMLQRYDAECQAADPANCTDPNCPNGVEAAYNNAVDENVMNFIDEVRSKGQNSVTPIDVAEISDTQAETLQALNGTDYTGYTVCLTGDAIAHIDKRHGENGKADRSMADDRDIARVGWVVKNFDSVQLLDRKSKQMLNSNGTPADMFIFSKRVNGNFYTAIAAPSTKRQRMYIVSAYKGKA